MAKGKVFVIGIDGATFEIIRPMVAKGELPTFKSLMEKGSYGKLISTYPPHTVPAWSSCYTGKNPGKLGIFDFHKDIHLSYDEGGPAFANDVKAKALWNVLSENGKSVMVIGMPMTYPPGQINGIMVAPVRLVDPDKLKFYPPELSDELFNNVGLGAAIKKRKEYIEMHTAKLGSDHETFLATAAISSQAVIEKLAEIVLYLMDKYKSDFGMFMLPIDALQHHFWCFMDKNHPAYDPDLADKYKNIIYEGYKWVDSALKRILGKLGEDDTIILVSDHGFGPLHKLFFLNRWLIEKGLLTLKKQRRYAFALKPILLSRLLQKIKMGFLADVLPETFKKMGIPMIRKVMKSNASLIDWEHTKAYATSYAININLKGREPLGTVDPGDYNALFEYIRNELYTLKDPATGQLVIDRVMEKNDIYHGPYVENAPDILLFFKDPKYSVRKDLFSQDLFTQLTPKDRLSGHHTSFPEGICIMKGPNIVPNSELNNPNIIDIAPTVLYLMGEPLLQDMDGRVLTEAMSRDFLQSNPEVVSQFTHDYKEEENVEIKLMDEDNEAIRKQLKDLGYMG